MTVEMVATIKHFQGLSTDEMPTEDVPTGSTFHCLDTGDEYVRYAEGWILDLRRAAAIKRSLTI